MAAAQPLAASRLVSWTTVALAACSVATAVALLALPPEIQPDTASYLAHSPERAPLYPYLLDLFRALFGPGPGAWVWLARLQTASLAAASAFFARHLGRALDLSLAWRNALFLLLALPGLKFAAVLITEPLGYVLLIVFWALLAEQVLTGRDRRLWLCALCGLGLLLRPQFVFLPVFLGVILFVRALYRRDGASLVGLALLALVLAGVVALRGAETQARHGAFSTASSGGVHLLSSLLYIAEAGDAAAIPDPAARELFLDTLSRAQARRLTRASWDKSRAHFDVAMEGLVFDVVRPALGLRVAAADAGPAGQARLEDSLAMSVAAPLLEHMPGRFIGLLARKFYDGQPFYYALIVIGGLLALARSLRAGSRPCLLFAMATLHSCLSYGVILLAGVYSLRYILPAEAILLAVAVAVGGALLGPPVGADATCGATSDRAFREVERAPGD